MNHEIEKTKKTQTKLLTPEFILDECELPFNDGSLAMPCPAYNSCNCDHIACPVFMG